MRFVIVGPGALGSVIAASLGASGQDVSVLGRPSPHLAALRNGGLRLQRLDGSDERVALSVSDDPTIVAAAETIVVLVKAGDTAAAMRAIAPHVNADQVVLTLQNGLGNVERIRAELGAEPHVLAGVTAQAATRLGPGSVRHAGAGPTLIGALAPHDAPLAAWLAAIFAAAGLPAAAVPDIERRIWQKVAINAAINGLTALAGVRNGQLLADPALLDAAETVAEEAASVARAFGFETGPMRRVIIETAAATADNRSSMLQDLDAGRRTEVDAIQGAILAAGREVGLLLPATQVVAATIQARERRAGVESIDGETEGI
jgi:2-dehydropantoate 2-reductase